ncbi:MAG: hypothetical protein GVY12_14440 [Bacteroidetes bacterium]|jgi:uncharacterized damage-inducible protein DinB|nr:hypothetical protein [Bacteroidota bacterium]
MSPDYFVELFDYDSTVNRELLEALRAASNPDERMIAVFAHLLAAKKVWMGRLSGRPADTPIWPNLDFSQCEALITENQETYSVYLQDTSDWDLMGQVRYQNSKGTEFTNCVREVLMHVLIHSGYHRGQIAQSMRQERGEPINTGYIFYLRDRG